MELNCHSLNTLVFAEDPRRAQPLASNRKPFVAHAFTRCPSANGPGDPDPGDPKEVPPGQPDEVPPMDPRPPGELPMPGQPDELPDNQPDEVSPGQPGELPQPGDTP